MEKRIHAIRHNQADETIWLLEHPPCYSRGMSASDKDLLRPPIHPIYEARRGGGYSWHGQGQLIVYIMLNLHQRRHSDLRQFIYQIEGWIIASLNDMGLKSERSHRHHGVWQEDKIIASIGLAIRHGVSWHGISINLSPDLSDLKAIAPCGLSSSLFSSVKAQGFDISMDECDEKLRQHFHLTFS